MAASSSSSCKSPTSDQQGSFSAAATARQRQPPSNLVDDILIKDPGAAQLCDCDNVCQALQSYEKQALQSYEKLGLHQQRTGVEECSGKGSVTARKIHKADREKLRRDRLNEQLLELAGAIESDKPKSDKFTILSEAIQALQDLTTKVQHLREEHASLSEESHDLSQEKKELQEEKSQLRAVVERLQCQLQQQMHAMLSWMASDPSIMMSAGMIPYPIPVHTHGSNAGNPQDPRGTVQKHAPFLAPGPYMPIPLMPGPINMHPALQSYYQHASGGTYFQYPYHFIHGHAQPATQIHFPVHTAAGYNLQSHPIATHGHFEDGASDQEPGWEMHRNPGSNLEIPPVSNAGPEASDMAPSHLPNLSSVHTNDQHICRDSSQNVHTMLQLQTPSSL